MSNTNEKEILEAVEKTYKIDINAIRNLSSISTDLIKNNILKLKGNLKTNNIYFKNSSNELNLSSIQDGLVIKNNKSSNGYIELGSIGNSKYHNINFKNGDKIKFSNIIYDSVTNKKYLQDGESIKQSTKNNYLKAGNYQPNGNYQKNGNYLKTINSGTPFYLHSSCKGVKCWPGGCARWCPNENWIS